MYENIQLNSLDAKIEMGLEELCHVWGEGMAPHFKSSSPHCNYAVLLDILGD